MRIALTFDAEHADRPYSDPENVLRILNVLGDEVRATFFVQGRWAQAYPDLARSIVEQGHALGNHTHHHAPSTWLTREGFLHDVNQAERIIEAITDKDTRPWFRPAFGITAPRFEPWLRELGYYPPVLWNVGSEDWTGIPADEIAAKVLDNLQDRYIVLMHTWPDATADAVSEILKADVEFVTLGALQ